MKNTYEGNVEITKENEKEWGIKLKKVKKISGDVRAYNGSITAPLLAEVGGDVRAANGSKLDFPLLAEVGGCVRAHNGSITAPLLAEVGGDVWADNGSITAPLLAEVGGDVRADNGSIIKLTKDHRENIGSALRSRIMEKVRASFKRKGYLFADNILSRIISKRDRRAHV